MDATWGEFPESNRSLYGPLGDPLPGRVVDQVVLVCLHNRWGTEPL
jgi:hypothetical protein